jgi:preprotein translocase subunit SecE
VARNRKRAKERRNRRPESAVSRPGVATARAQRNDDDDSASPMRHAAPDVELAEAQLALGRPELAGEEESDEDLDEFEAEAELAASTSRSGGGDGGSSGGGGGELSLPGAAAPAHRPHIGSRLINFLQGSWRELQRVQWPDRRQVMQATGVVIGFVIVAGAFLGVADLVATKIMNFILG